MEREIKFRAFIKSLKWIVPVEMIDFSSRTVEVDLSDGNGDTSEYGFDEIELMQFTGLKDENGREIWESDTVLAGGIHYEVYQHPSGDWQAGGLSIWEQSGEYSEENEWEVVGNVFDNPELMENNYES